MTLHTPFLHLLVASVSAALLSAAPSWAQSAYGSTTSSATANPLTASSLHQRALAATCANCHGPEGRVTAGSAVPGLAGLPSAYTVTQMKAFKDGSRPATVMHQITKGYSDAQIQSVADYFASIKP
ncbi:MAG: cytochrome C [Betaproteobacteria bacterium]|nr:cytochrome C [Betaproteobacteria bacterium]NBY71653.1 cytochrome C [Betaproteobacteria bacterium]NDD11386.1 cytochrome C [Betaproteobacteria bacterium]